ncbi:MAG: hypothetical protein AAGJ82_11155 [Bacteroidota bacterium]
MVLLFVVFEVIIPHYDPRFIADPWDGLAYLLGAVLYVQLRKLSGKQ